MPTTYYCLLLPTAASRYADGGNLADRIVRQAASGEHFATERVLGWLAQLCSALQHVHAHRVLHRDLKTQNVFLTAAVLLALTLTLSLTSSSQPRYDPNPNPYSNPNPTLTPTLTLTLAPTLALAPTLPPNQGEIKLGDFGISRALSTRTNLAQTMCGTTYY